MPGTVNKTVVKESLQKAAPGPPHRGANAMCEKCEEIDKKIDHYRLIVRQILDQEFTDRANALITELEAEKAALHPT